MKKLFSFLLWLVWVSAYSQLSLPVTWDVGGPDFTTTNFGGTSSSLVPDPLDPSNTVLQIVKPQGANFWAGTTIGKDFAPKINNGGFPAPIPLAANNGKITVRVRTNLAPGTPIMVKIERTDNGGIFVERSVNRTAAAGEWENMVFDFTGANFADNYDKLSVFPYFICCASVPALADHNFWIDNISMGLPPVISSFAPTSETSGNTVTISGSGFTGATAVSFGNSPAASFTVVNDNSITAVVGVGATGSVKVTTPVSSTTSAGFTFIPPATAPTITSFTPTSGATGTTITINGTNFNTATAVNFGGDAAASFNIVSATQITAVVASGNTGAIAVTNPDGFATLAGFTYIPPAPTITSFTPTGTGQFGVVTITGSNFIDINSVTFGGTAASSFTVVNQTTITATVGSGSSGSVAVTNPGGTATLAGYTFKSPISLPITFGNASVDYTTTDFGSNVSSLSTDPLNGANAVLRVFKPAGAQTWAGTTLGKDFAPKVNNGGLSAPIPFTATGKVITAKVYSPLPVGTPILCKVENTTNGGINDEVLAFTTVQNGWSTLFWNLTGVNTANSYDKISFFMNFNAGGSAASIFYLDDVDYYPNPTVTSFLPTSATTGATVTITGTNFNGATAVSFGGISASSFTIVDNTTITAVVGLGASGSVAVTRGGTASLAGFTFNAAPTGATVTSFLPTSAGETGIVTITGTNFTTATAVSFGGVAASSFTIVDDNTITAVVGSGASGNVAVTNPSGIGTLAGFSYIPKAPISLPISWDTPVLVDYSTTDFGNNSSSQDLDPTNASNRVLKIVKPAGAQTWAGTTLGKVGVNNGGFPTAIPFTPANRFLTARVYSTRPIGTLIMLKVEQATAGAQNSEKAVATTVQNAWETMVFDFGSQTGGNPLNYSGVSYDKLSVFCNFNQAGTASANTFYIDDVKFVPGPIITSFTPTSAATGTTVTINGDNFSNVTSVRFGGTLASSFTIVNDNQITAVVAAGTSGSVSVVNPVGASNLAGFDYIAPPGAPTVASFNPASSIVGGSVTISGSNFNTATAVKFGGTDAGSYTIVNSSTILAVVGPGSTGSVSVTNSFGTGSKAGFTFLKKRIALPVLWDDFATVDYTSGDFCGLASALATDPLNPSNTVMRLTKTPVSAACAGTTFGNNAMLNPIPFALGNTTISVRFYTTQPVGLPVLLKLEGNAGPIEKLLTTTTVGWQVLEFDFAASANLTDVYNRLVFFPGFNQIAGSNQVTYVDNIIFGSFATNVWKGTSSTDFLEGSNWTLGFPPLDCSMNLQINANTPFSAVLASGNYSGGNINIASGASLTVNSGATYSICGNILNGSISGNGTVVFSGTSAQSILGNHNVRNITVTKPTASGNVTLNGTMNLNGVLTLSNANANFIIGAGGKLILASNATETGSIAAIPAGASVIGNVTQQRYLPGSGNGWYFLGTPINKCDFSQWTDNMYMAAGTSLGGNQGVTGLGIQHSTIFKYDETMQNVATDTVQKYGWRVPVLGDSLKVGQGFRVWLKAYNTPSRTIDNVGPVRQGNFTFPTLKRTEPANCQTGTTSYTVPCDESFRGWNLLANPFPSAINWDAVGWTKPAQMLNGFYRWNAQGNGYGVYTGGSYAGAGPAPTNPGLIASGQGFFVKLQNAGVYDATLSLTEAVKSSNTNTFLRTASSNSRLKISLESPNAIGYNYMAEVRVDKNATDGIDAQMDIPNLTGNGFYFTMPVGNDQLIINTIAPFSEIKNIPLNTVFYGITGQYKFDFSGIESFEAGTTMFLRDNYTEMLTKLNDVPFYNFNVDANSAGMTNRFELILAKDGLVSIDKASKGMMVSIYPNPTASKQISLSIEGKVNGEANISVIDLMGKTVYRTKQNLRDGKNQFPMQLNLGSGMYSVKIQAGTKTVVEKLIIK